MKKYLSILVGVILTFTFSSAVHAENLILNGSFEDVVPPTLEDMNQCGGVNYLFPVPCYSSGDINHWNVIDAIWSVSNDYWQAQDGSRSIAFNAHGQGSIKQTIVTVPGTVYLVTFYMSGNPNGDLGDKTMTVTAGITPKTFHYDTSEKRNSLADMMWEENSYGFVATGTNTTLTFTSTTSGSQGPALDNVSTSIVTTADGCKFDGWKNFGMFSNQGDCISYIATGGKNLPSGQ